LVDRMQFNDVTACSEVLHCTFFLYQPIILH
jgi:hypothetical protein